MFGIYNSSFIAEQFKELIKAFEEHWPEKIHPFPLLPNDLNNYNISSTIEADFELNCQTVNTDTCTDSGTKTTRKYSRKSFTKDSRPWKTISFNFLLGKINKHKLDLSFVIFLCLLFYISSQIKHEELFRATFK